MCRLFGLVADEPVATKYWMVEAPHPFRRWSDRHGHGWGIGWYEDGDVRLTREPLPAHESAEFALTAASARSQHFICHLRKATCGDHAIRNTHPFSYGRWLFGHNGTIDGSHFRRLLTQSHRDALVGDTDSEVYFHWLLQAMEQDRGEGLRLAIREVRKREFTALNFLLSDGHTLSAYWEQSSAARPPYPDYYQLRYAIRSDRRSGIRQVIVCSECLDDDSWEPIPPATLVSITSQLQVQTVAVRE